MILELDMDMRIKCRKQVLFYTLKYVRTHHYYIVLILLLHLFIDKHLMMFCSAWKTCVTYSVSHNSIHHPEFSGNQGNHHNFVSILVAHKL